MEKTQYFNRDKRRSEEIIESSLNDCSLFHFETKNSKNKERLILARLKGPEKRPSFLISF